MTTGSNQDSNSADSSLSVTGQDQPGSRLINVPFDGTNFQRWSRSIKIALAAKVKLGFINGSCKKPAETDSTYEQWIRADYMVLSWILNSMLPEI